MPPWESQSPTVLDTGLGEESCEHLGAKMIQFDHRIKYAVQRHRRIRCHSQALTMYQACMSGW